MATGNVNPKNDTIVLLSLDGAQLYRNKQSQCYMYLWVILNRSPKLRYKKPYVLPGGIIPGPLPPKNLDSFLFTGLHHLAALQKTGLRIWSPLHEFDNQDSSGVFTSYPYLALATADGPAMACVSGLVGHIGKQQCRVYCPQKGRRLKNQSHYYPALLCPNYPSPVEGSDHADYEPIDLLRAIDSESTKAAYEANLRQVIAVRGDGEYRNKRRETGIVKPCILQGLPPKRHLPVPECFPLDIMHLATLNLPDLFIGLWRATIKPTGVRTSSAVIAQPWAVLASDETWRRHGKHVADCKKFIPGSYGRPPRNISEKLNSGYKATEFQLYFYGLGPCLLASVLPNEYWRHYCLGVRAFRILMQEEVSATEVVEAQQYILKWVKEFELIYYERDTSRLHFVRPSMHAPMHLAPGTVQLGPVAIYAQWVMERLIGSLGEEIGLHSDPYENLGQRAVRRCMINALRIIYPSIDKIPKSVPRGGIDLGDGYALLRAKDRTPVSVTALENQAIERYMRSVGHSEVSSVYKVTRWARLRLPNGQIARSSWKEETTRRNAIRISRNVKVCSIIDV